MPSSPKQAGRITGDSRNRTAGGKVQRDDRLPDRPVTAVDFTESRRVGDKNLYVLKTLKNLTTLTLRGTNIKDAGLKEIREIKSLTTLYLGFPQITDAGLKELRDLKNLTTLDLSCNQITDAGLKELSELKNLTTLILYGTKITDAGLKELGELKNLMTVEPRLYPDHGRGLERAQRAQEPDDTLPQPIPPSPTPVLRSSESSKT